ncbi:DUF6705 family protein [Flavobacterium terrigena]|uniref:DUF6705 family protein n=1 Tax=Flavobacterium terrigena TaxID=402734 RepID=UPI00115FF6A3|nr:DUF6705 family protein [Flavobacterium terrigena]
MKNHVISNIMKKQIIYIFLLCTSSLFAQYPVLTTTSLSNPDHDDQHSKHGNYAIDTNNDRQQYVGLWRYTTNDLLFELKIVKLDKLCSSTPPPTGYTRKYSFIDGVVITYKLVKNGIIIYDNLNTIFTNTNYHSWGYVEAPDDFLYGRMKDFNGGATSIFTITNLNTSPNKIYFDLSSMAYSLDRPKETYQHDVKLFTLPTGGIEMIRVY